MNLAPPSITHTPDVFTIDVEDWFHILEVSGTPDISAWNTLPSRLERNFRSLLELLAAWNVRATCFTLGWVADRFPHLLLEAAEQGHDIASHGYSHQLVHRLTPEQFQQDIRKARIAIENATGRPVRGYRAPGFSITADTPWAFEELVKAGYTFDSSVFPASHGHGGMSNVPQNPHVIDCSAGRLVEFPISVANTPLGPKCFFGGGYLRLYPLRLVMAMAKRVRKEGNGVVWYIHPREIDPDHPRLEMPLARRFRSYVNLRTTAEKLKAILQTGTFATFSDLAAGFSREETKQASIQ